jgi:DNA relaxase NicK
VDDLVSALGPSLVLPGKGIHGWSQSVQAFDGEGYLLGGVYFGARQDVHVLSTSDAAHWARSAVGSMDRARTSRVDTRFDTLAAWDDLEAVAMEAASTYGTQVTTMETLNGPRQGRTIYLGAPSSAIRVRMYEKWRESPGQYVDGTNRVEVQLRPASRIKEDVSTWTPGQTFCASKTATDLALLLGADASEQGSLHVKRDTPTLEQSLQAMSHQYGGAVSRWLEHSAGDFSKVVDYLLAKHDDDSSAPGRYEPGTNEPASVAADGGLGPARPSWLGVPG